MTETITIPREEYDKMIELGRRQGFTNTHLAFLEAYKQAIADIKMLRHVIWDVAMKVKPEDMEQSVHEAYYQTAHYEDKP